MAFGGSITNKSNDFLTTRSNYTIYLSVRRKDLNYVRISNVPRRISVLIVGACPKALCLGVAPIQDNMVIVFSVPSHIAHG